MFLYIYIFYPESCLLFSDIFFFLLLSVPARIREDCGIFFQYYKFVSNFRNTTNFSNCASFNWWIR